MNRKKPAEDAIYHFVWLWKYLGYFMVITIVVASLIPIPNDSLYSTNDKIFHFLSYCALMFWFAHVYPIRRHWILCLFIVFLGVAIEGMQYTTGYRHADFGDVIANTLGAVVGWGIFQTPARRILQTIDGKLENLFKANSA